MSGCSGNGSISAAAKGCSGAPPGTTTVIWPGESLVSFCQQLDAARRFARLRHFREARLVYSGRSVAGSTLVHVDVADGNSLGSARWTGSAPVNDEEN